MGRKSLVDGLSNGEILSTTGINTSETIKQLKILQKENDTNIKKTKQALIKVDNGTLIMNRENLNFYVDDILGVIYDLINLTINLYNSNIDTLKDDEYIDKDENGNYYFT